MKIESYFSGIKAANEAVEALKKVGITDAVADINDHFTGNDNPGTNSPGTSSSTNSLANLVLRNDDPVGDPSVRPAAAASPMVSGMGGFEEIADVNYKVIVNIDDNNAERVKQIIAKMGGDLRDPNFKMPKGFEDKSLDDLLTNMINEMNMG
ncbi:hypothetical protein [Clostridium saccharobutylicum]|uniref:Uncharacterized protein n=1 Tax=Clostridium saccharobutylicum DSM 13864 TaxID=1345695 RepID=U5MSP0_CLOSA|nr:hypothetical protein [Clostridium saccharobutylicum]AGX43528.1 hypothetical protein CLSA_c25560 [Clostridium saccharobutylicum DSM 13864]AQR90825.1 hypothetical protein CLOSC_25460 [Clostridium saccharobutylicum]AQS00729.1 hypothetical protein CSACC_25530 [Clostridium saccharobutylicum]AQS10389.1 hypothetical protein CLOBY_25320 [Clostridium saccharobutylicum]AQS14712.1 hypothetical protein CLOSACC_25530 [Clostridium saccharobutylicum]